MAPIISAADERLMLAYQEAALRINRALQDATPRNRRVILNRIDTLIRELDALTAEYIDATLPLHFQEGTDEAIRDLRNLSGFAASIDESFGVVHQEALQALAEEASLKFATALEGVRSDARSKLTRMQRENVVRELISSEVEGANNPSARVKAIFEGEKIESFQGKRRAWGLEEYSSMLTHVLLADAHNTGAVTRYAANGIQYARRIERPDCCEICRPLRNKYVWIGDRRLIPPSHPYCYGSIAPFIGVPENPIMDPFDKRIPERTRRVILRR